MDITQKVEALGFGRYLGTFEPNSQEWHAAREGIGGSDIGAHSWASHHGNPLINFGPRRPAS